MNRVSKIIAITILTSLLLSGLTMAGCSSAPAQSDHVDNQAPDFHLPDLDGKIVSLSSFRGKPVMLNFWASWCPPCREETPYIQQVYEEWSGKGVVVLGINVGENISKAKEFAQGYGLSFPILLDTEGEAAQKYEPQGLIPRTFFIDEKGVIRARVIGAFPSKEAIENKLREIIP